MRVMDWGGVWRTAEDFVRRHLKSKAVRDAEARRQERQSQAIWRRMKSSALFSGLPAAGIFGFAVTVAPVAAAAVAAGGAALAGMAAARLWALRPNAAKFSRDELRALPGAAEDWLLEKRLLLPRGAEEALDSILVHLGELPPRLAVLDPNETRAWDARRLIGDHLPRLVDAWCSLPALTRERDREAGQRLLDGLATLAEELTRLFVEVSREERMRLETQSRFIEARYKDPGEGA
jgi:hypothetical protein